jgi:hypothetical protein
MTPSQIAARDAAQLLLSKFDPPVYGIPEALKEAMPGNLRAVPGILERLRCHLGQCVTRWETGVTAEEAANALVVVCNQEPQQFGAAREAA